jgi:hypothetical protein
MCYWRVDQDQAYRQNQVGGYLWSPKRSAKTAWNPFCEATREVTTIRIVFTSFDTPIIAIGEANYDCWKNSKSTGLWNPRWVLQFDQLEVRIVKG